LGLTHSTLKLMYTAPFVYALNYVIIPTVGHQYYSIIITTDFSHDQIQSRIPENPERVSLPRAAWRFNQSRQALHQQTHNLLRRLASPGGQECAARRFLFQEPRTHTNAWVAWRWFITRQAASGKIPETQNFKELTVYKHPIYHASHIINNMHKITESSSPNLEFLRLNWNAWELSTITNDLPLGFHSTSPKTHSHSLILAISCFVFGTTSNIGKPFRKLHFCLLNGNLRLGEELKTSCHLIWVLISHYGVFLQPPLAAIFSRVYVNPSSSCQSQK